MKEYKCLISVMAECEDDMHELLETMDGYSDSNLEWWTEVAEVKSK